MLFLLKNIKNKSFKQATKNGWLICCLFYLFTGILQSQNSIIKNGVNIQASYYNRGNVTIGWNLMDDYPEIEAVRIEIEPERASRAVEWIREAQKAGYQVIATYHEASDIGF